ncbi:uncharacterized protein LOC109720350 [Ananas comosus]|uniref:Uncharacterized protein LOC109720350 n=1 Tax=Ananas comosus TaxID=4615 RepID=A0A6P5GAW4_ANACO|nr:uncharacterized protein LOC109720350 [Ananas comosus]
MSTTPFDYSFICLIPKKEGVERVNDFRSISLINGIQKIISKVLINRIAAAMNELISPSQSAFLKGRNITDAYVTISEIIEWGSKKFTEGVGIKVDFEKAYDRIQWPFFFKILQWWGFDATWCAWIEQCVCNAKVAILVNGEATNWIKMKRGVRQGDPLSPFLFLLVAECLARLTSKATSNNLFKGIGPSDESITTLTQFADDTFVFSVAWKRYMRNLRLMWHLFEWASGLKINREKSELYYLGKTESKAARLVNLLDCKVGTFPTSYLGFPLSPKPPTKETWRFWSNGGGDSIQHLTYSGSRLSVPYTTKEEDLCGRETASGPSHTGGKEWCGDTTLQTAFPEVYELLDSNPMLIKDCFRRDDWNWTKILGDESIFTPGLGPDISSLKDRVSSFKIEHKLDKIGWRWCSNDLFSVKSVYRMLSDGGTRDGHTNLIWKLRIPLKVKVLCWLVLKKRLLTTDNFVKRGWTGDTACVLCRAYEEWKGGSGMRIRSNGLSELVACWWTIWKARNNLIFRNLQLDPILAVQRLKMLLSSWKDML